MIPLHKLERLPRSQRMRKIAKMFAEAENRLCAAQGAENALNASALVFFAELAEHLAADSQFQAAAGEAFREAVGVFRQGNDLAAVRRSLNAARHLLLAETGRFPADWDFIDSGGKLDPARRRFFPGMAVYLEDIRSPFNIGAIFRTAESFGAEKMFLSPLCADPCHPRAVRTAMGCVDILPWERRELPSLPPGPVFALETGGTPLAEFPFPPQGLLIAGSEELGVSPRLLALADASLGRVSIPCWGAKGSLNVSVAFGIVMHAWAQCIKNVSIEPVAKLKFCNYLNIKYYFDNIL